MCTEAAQLVARRRKLERRRHQYGKSDITLVQEVRGPDGSEVELRYFCRQARIFYSAGSPAEAGGFAFMVHPEFLGRFAPVEFEVVVPGRIAIVRCRGPDPSTLLDIAPIHLVQAPGGPSTASQLRSLRERVASQDDAVTPCQRATSRTSLRADGRYATAPRIDFVWANAPTLLARGATTWVEESVFSEHMLRDHVGLQARGKNTNVDLGFRLGGGAGTAAPGDCQMGGVRGSFPCSCRSVGKGCRVGLRAGPLPAARGRRRVYMFLLSELQG